MATKIKQTFAFGFGHNVLLMKHELEDIGGGEDPIETTETIGMFKNKEEALLYIKLNPDVVFSYNEDGEVFPRYSIVGITEMQLVNNEVES